MSDTEQHNLEARVAAMESVMEIALRRLLNEGALDKDGFVHAVEFLANGHAGDARHEAEAAVLFSLIAKL